jgi:hypothetical protein
MTKPSSVSPADLRDEEARVVALETELWLIRTSSRFFAVPTLVVLRGALGDPRVARASSATIIRVLRLIDSLHRRAAVGRVISREWAQRARALATLVAALDRKADFTLSRRVDHALDGIARAFGATRAHAALDGARAGLRRARRWVNDLRRSCPPPPSRDHAEAQGSSSLVFQHASSGGKDERLPDEIPHPGRSPLGELLHREQQARISVAFARARAKRRRRASNAEGGASP